MSSRKKVKNTIGFKQPPQPIKKGVGKRKDSQISDTVTNKGSP